MKKKTWGNVIAGSGILQLCTYSKKIRGNRWRKVINILRVVPVIIDGAKEAACSIVCYAMALLFSGRDPCFQVTKQHIARVRAMPGVEPISNSCLQPACIIAACVVSTTLQLVVLIVSDWRLRWLGDLLGHKSYWGSQKWLPSLQTQVWVCLTIVWLCSNIYDCHR